MIIVLKQYGTCVNYLNSHTHTNPFQKKTPPKCDTSLYCLNCKPQNYYDTAPEHNFYKAVIIY